MMVLSPHLAIRIETGVFRSVTWLEDGTIVAIGLWNAGDVIDRTLIPELVQLECLTKVEATLLTEWQQESEALLA